MMMDGPSPDFTGCCLMQRSQAKQVFIKCKNCTVIFHARCVGLDSVIARYLEDFVCISCEPLVGPTTFKSKRNEHRLDPLVIDDEMSLPVQTGTRKFLQELRKRSFTSCEGIVRYMTGEQLTLQNFAQNGFNKPIIVSRMDDDLGLLVPPTTFTFQDVQDLVGPNREIDVIMSTRQSNTTMQLREFLDHFKNRSEILNSLSLEFSQTALSPYVEAPRIVRQLDWASQVWSKDYEQSIGGVTSVQKYCIMSMKNSFTDFHIDFGGTSVWYHVLRGQKIFYIIPPTPANLAFYQTWQKSEKSKETFFGDQVDFTYQCTVEAGNTLLLPTGWIHAVLTPEDSLVFGGNFLHNLAIPLQLRVYEIEKNTDIVDNFLYPYFESINWFAATHLVSQIAEYNAKRVCCPQFLLQGIKALIPVLKHWNHERSLNKGKHEPIPDLIEPQKLIKELNKEVRQAERIQNTVNPPKPERESKRRKKKPMDKDFVDITQSLSIQNLQPKSALKSTVKAPSKKLAIQPPPPPPPAQTFSLKLTLPKPSTYPYLSHTSFAPCSDLVDVKSEHVDGKSTVLRIKRVNRPAPSSSVYDFHDSDEEQLQIDERPKKLRADKKVLGVTFSIRKHESTDMADMEVAGEVDVESDAPKNGIDELLKASTTAFDLDTSVPAQNKFGINNPVSPSNNTSDAIDGILAIGNPYVDEKCDFQTNGVRNKRKLPPTTSTSHEEEEPMAKVHQDESFVYFSLDYSDGEEHVFKPRGKRKMDEAWNPKARVGHVLPKTDRPIREGTKKQSVEKCLEAAAAKRVGTAEPKRPYTRKKPKLMPVATSTASTSSSTATAATAAATSCASLPAKKVEPKVKKPKKGMATVKQRLGKKLKIHRMTF